MRQRIEYADQNESFARYLPRVGQTTCSFTSDAGTPGWFLFELEEPFEYQLKVGQAFRFREVVVTHFLLRSRWVGYDIGAANPTSVFILLVEEGAVPLSEPFTKRTTFTSHGARARVKRVASNKPLQRTGLAPRR